MYGGTALSILKHFYEIVLGKTNRSVCTDVLHPIIVLVRKLRRLYTYYILSTEIRTPYSIVLLIYMNRSIRRYVVVPTHFGTGTMLESTSKIVVP